MTYIRTYSGERFYPDGTGKIHPVDIAHALSNLCRFGGHSNRFYSVAQHSILVSFLVPREQALAGLLHDASEAYLADLPTPIKYRPELAGYRELERTITERVEARFKLPRGALSSPAVKAADAQALALEAEECLGLEPHELEEWGLPGQGEGLKLSLSARALLTLGSHYDCEDMEVNFLHRLKQVS